MEGHGRGKSEKGGEGEKKGICSLIKQWCAAERTVDVMSDEHKSHTYLTPPSPPLVAVFFRITPIGYRRDAL